MTHKNTLSPEAKEKLIEEIINTGPETIIYSINSIMATMALYTTQLLYKSMDTDEYVWTIPDKVEESIAYLYGLKNTLEEVIKLNETEKKGK